MIDVILPRSDPDMTEGTIVEWLKKEGESVEKGEPIVKVEGEKVIFEVNAQGSGVLRKILASKGVNVPIATRIAIITELGEEISDEELEIIRPKAVRTKTEKVAAGVVAAGVVAAGVVEKRVRASPSARRIAKERNVDITTIDGRGPGGRVAKEDVLRYIEESVKAIPQFQIPETAEIITLSGMRKTIADRMTFSYSDIPQLAVGMEVNMNETLKLRERTEATHGVKISLTALFSKVTALALKKHPYMNSTIESDQIKIFKNVNIGIAVSVEGGLMVPVIKDVDKKGILEIDSTLKNLIEKARNREITTDELKGGTFTISNLGSFDVDFFTPIINPPEAAILGICRIVEKPRVIAGKIKIVPVLLLTLTFDHRIVDGAKAAQFLSEIKNALEEPACMLS